MHFEKNVLEQIQNGRLSAIIQFCMGRYLVNRTRWLDHYYKTKCDFSGEDAPCKVFTLIKIQNG